MVNVKIDKEMKQYIVKKIVLIFLISTLFYYLFKFNFGDTLGIFILFIFLIFGFSSLYQDIKLEIYNHRLEKRLNNIEYILRGLKK